MNNNYEFNADNTDPDAVVCGSTELFRLTPSGEISDFGGIDGSATPGVGAGGLYGAGFGITLDPHGAVWVSNFGFQGTNCPNEATQLFVSVSQFSAHGIAQSPDGDPPNNVPGGYRGHDDIIQAPQGIKSDQRGNIWVANCATDSVVALNSDGAVLDTVAYAEGINHPMGIASDSFGNLWVANAGVMNPPCPAVLAEEDIGEDGGLNEKASVTLIDQSNGAPVATTYGISRSRSKRR